MIIINARFLTQNITGVQRYGIELCRALKSLDNTIRFIAPKNICHHEIANELGVETCGILTGHLWEQFELPLYLKKHKNPLLLNLANAAPLMYKKKITNIHDIVFEHFPNSVSWKFRILYKLLIPRVIKTSLHVTTDSEFSKNDISNFYKIDKKHFTVVHLGTPKHSEFDGINQKENMILAVGSIQPYKNLKNLIEAFLNIQKKSNSKYILKLVGGMNAKVFKNANIFETIMERKDIIFTGYLSDDELKQTYKKAKIFVFPSLFEGFGLPPLEAMAFGCPVLASNAASIPEVCGEAALYFDPTNSKEMADKMLAILGDDELQQRMVALGYENIQKFTWESSARKMLEIANRYL